MESSEFTLRKAISDLENDFGRLFGLKSFPGEVFSINPKSSYVRHYRGESCVMVYVYRYDPSRGWLSFSKDSPAACRTQFLRLNDCGDVPPLGS